MTGQIIQVKNMPRKSRKKPFILSVSQFFERSPNEASVRAFIEKCLWEDGIAICPKYAARNALFEVRKPRPRFLQASRRALSMQGLRESPFGGKRHRFPQKQAPLEGLAVCLLLAPYL
ncbi:MAG: hypothetical protein ISN28_15095 [Ectothiorhodospiraceae bacterium AqS1]|nr:hypothetical protein [Ectothiorhodospiraceae bacterium AqS1]